IVKFTLTSKGMNMILQSASTDEINDCQGSREAHCAPSIRLRMVIAGRRIANAATLKALETNAVDDSYVLFLFLTENLGLRFSAESRVNTAWTTLLSKTFSQGKDYFSSLAVDAVLRLQGSIDLQHIQIVEQVGGKLTDSNLDEGFTKLLLCLWTLVEFFVIDYGAATDTDKVKDFGARFKVDGKGELAELKRAEREKMKAKVEAITLHGINIFNRQLIYNYPESLLPEKGIMVIEHADFEGVERLSLADGSEIASTFDHPELVKLGNCELIEEVMIGEDKLIKFSGVAAGEACTVVLRGSTNQMVDEAERSLHDALSVLSQTVKETRTVLGGGCSEMLMSCAVEEAARSVKGKHAIATGAFGRALRQIPVILAGNAGLDSSDLVVGLRVAHYDRQADAGLGKT
ncbi:putative T-complex protein 1 subunit beta, partial [Leucoagaricus sp. SymC.cos]